MFRDYVLSVEHRLQPAVLGLAAATNLMRTAAPPNLTVFTQLGLVDCNFRPKPALAAWDALYVRRLD